MLRRTFLAAALALPAIPALAAGPNTIDYTPGAIQAALAEGKTVFVDYATDWCSTCARQASVIEKLRAENPAYEAMTFIRVDWDDYGTHEVATSRNIPRRSTLVVLKGNKEIARLVAGTSEATIKQLLDLGLAASS